MDKGILLSESCQKIGIRLSEEQMEQFLIYYEYLVEKNKVMNLTGITEYEEVVLKHFADSLSIVKVIDPTQCRRVIDVGTGAGFPGIPLKIAFPELEVVLLDSLNKRVQFLNEVIEKLHLDKITAIHARAEDAAKRKEYRESFDLCVSRAVANLASLLEYCLPFVTIGGKFISYKSSDIDEEIEQSKKALYLLGGKMKNREDFALLDSDIRRTFVVIEKERKTPAKYPRKAGLPSKEPLK